MFVADDGAVQVWQDVEAVQERKHRHQQRQQAHAQPGERPGGPDGSAVQGSAQAWRHGEAQAASVC